MTAICSAVRQLLIFIDIRSQMRLHVCSIRFRILPSPCIFGCCAATGVILQRCRDGGLADVKTFWKKEGLSWKTGDRTRTETDLRAWYGKRGQAGRLPPHGFSKTGTFG